MNPPMNKKEIYEYYSNEDILNKLVENSKDREISASLFNGSYLNRPNIIMYPRDVLEMVKGGCVSFHGSVELWKNPMRLDTKLSEEQLNELRTGWDLIIDIDSALGIEAAKLAAKRVVEFLKSHGIRNPGIKFSGNRGFHIGVPWKAFPKKIDYEPTKNQFPRIPRIIASYMRNEIKDKLLQDLISLKGSLRELVEDVDQYLEELTPYIFVEIEKDWGSRHLFRLPYSINEKSWLVSVPISIDDIDSFELDDATPERIKAKKDFFQEVKDGEATNLVMDALDWYSQIKEERSRKKNEKPKKIMKTKKVPEERFPPCIKKILGGLSDGRKRSVFILVNFLSNVGWSWPEVKKRIIEWNKNNKPPLRDNYISTQLKWFERQDRKLLPPNCDNKHFYKSFGVCHPDEKCKRIKNPVVYPFKK
ncbi:MAG: hypothetical protein J7L45_02635 [Candidatus Aenigmarchaeota archaeon]|nr:hypothetical protein [Candidatus Aenigmarchaeota archaeon]